MGYGYKWSYQNEVNSLEKQIRSLESLVYDSVDGELGDALMQVLANLRNKLYAAGDSYDSIPKNFN